MTKSTIKIAVVIELASRRFLGDAVAMKFPPAALRSNYSGRQSNSSGVPALLRPTIG
jgi:hypothetical protein